MGLTVRSSSAGLARYCLSYTATLVGFLPAASVSCAVSVRVLLLVENATVPVNSRLAILRIRKRIVTGADEFFFRDRVSAVGLPVTG